MSAQLFAVYALVGVACLFVARATFRTWFGGPTVGCGAGCGSCTAPAAEPVPTKRIGPPMAK